ncbi:AGAP004757-PA-like protein [Anopheles sinensis]|uniref:AGAP004757-PA-like protein n=1 Tax=Anopheles sinensis TaxID=74873 RepID=A0A084VUU2_ANOSI|nr:AGAP004757-PA-like protein [Anopheles sinensis]
MDRVELKVGQKLLLHVQNASYEGILRNVAPDRTFIRVAEVRDVETNYQLGKQDYYYNEINKVEVLENPPEVANPSGDDPEIAAASKTGLSDHCFDDALKKIEQCIIIQQTDTDQYRNSIRYLRNQVEFGVSLECIEDGQAIRNPSLLSFVTLRCIMIYDVQTMGVTEEVAEFLTNDCYRRVFHNGRWMRDVLLERYGFTLGKCLDTMLAHNMLTEEETNSIEEPPVTEEVSIESCVAKYLKLPEKFFDMDVNFSERPLTDACKQEAAKRVAFLLDLWNHIVHDRMLEKLNGSCAVYADSLAKHTDFIDSVVVMRDRRGEALAEIKPFP